MEFKQHKCFAGMQPKHITHLPDYLIKQYSVAFTHTHTFNLEHGMCFHSNSINICLFCIGSVQNEGALR